jgi:hypothetical protein
MAQVVTNIMKKNIMVSHVADALTDNGDGTWDVTLQDGRKIRCKSLE